MRPKRFSFAFAAAMTFVAAGVFAAEAPQTTHEPLPPLPPQVAGPATAPANEARIRQWFADLADTNPSVRDRARVALMGIKVEELGALRAVADASRPLAPAQAAVLHDVVIHVYAGGTRVRAFQNEIEVSLKFGAEPQPRFGKSGFLGVLLEPVISGFGVGAPRAPAPDGADENQPDFIQLRTSGGVLIRETWPGFAGFRFLRVGDVVLGTGGAEPTRAPTVQELRGTVQGTPPDGTLDLSVLRQGRIVDVPITVSARPAWAEDEFTTRQMQSRRLRRAALYWQFAFAPLLLKDDGML